MPQKQQICIIVQFLQNYLCKWSFSSLRPLQAGERSSDSPVYQLLNSLCLTEGPISQSQHSKGGVRAHMCVFTPKHSHHPVTCPQPT